MATEAQVMVTAVLDIAVAAILGAVLLALSAEFASRFEFHFCTSG